PRLSGPILDLGCGYGVIGLSLALLNADADITMVDINNRAIELAIANADKNGLGNVDIFPSDGFTNVEGLYSTIISNPPIRAGKKVIYPLFEQSIDYLENGGSLYLVIQKKQGAKSAIGILNSIYGNCEVINKSGGYWILKSTKPTF
ncbi:MAG TPA: methyltransferase, partial [Bacillota bacterium]|nr:methyltransferase [Bacillota bacterium]